VAFGTLALVRLSFVKFGLEHQVWFKCSKIVASFFQPTKFWYFDVISFEIQKKFTWLKSDGR
jgi:hypothetical protein